MTEIKIDKKYYLGKDILDAILAHMDTVAALPAADVKPVVRGKWIPIRLGDCKCSVCNSVYGICGGLLGNYYFCPNCGADMREG